MVADRKALACGCLLALVAAAACREEPRARPSVLVICVDTLRGDRLGYQGYGRDTSPSIDALAARGTRFRQAYSTYPQTSPAVASLFTGLYPGAHRKTRAAGTTLAPELTTLAETFRAAGYRTAGVATNPKLSPGLGYEQGFEHYAFVKGQKRRDKVTAELGPVAAGTHTEVRHSDAAFYGRGDAANQAALEWLDGLALDEPFLLYLHYMDVHSPYAAPAPFREMFVEAPGRDRYTNGVPSRPVSAVDLAYTASLYDGGVRYLDSLVGELVQALEQRGRLAGTVVAFVADHGDEFLEHGGFGHGDTLYRELLHVPLFLVGPGIAAREVETPVTLIDLYPTLCELAGLAPPARLQGRSLVALWAGAGEATPGALLSECASTRLGSPAGDGRGGAHASRGRPGRPASLEPGFSLVEGEWHLLHGAGSERSELYRYREDPSEQHDLAGEHPEVVARLLARARELREQSELLGRDVQPAVLEVDEATRAELEALGYAGEDQ